jgi:hypothetical protein
MHIFTHTNLIENLIGRNIRLYKAYIDVEPRTPTKKSMVLTPFPALIIRQKSGYLSNNDSRKLVGPADWIARAFQGLVVY